MTRKGAGGKRDNDSDSSSEAQPKRTPDDALRRGLRLASVTAGVSGSYVGYLAQRVFLGEESRNEKLSAAHRKAGQQLASGLGELRGPAMKFGQLLSVQSEGLPEELLAELATLQTSAPPMHPTMVRARFKRSFGARPEEVFATFDPVPFAAASLGQVHRATTHAGDDVVVKLQYPDIARAITNDFKLLRSAALPARIAGYLPSSLLDELEAQIAAEADYRREASNMMHLRAGLAPLGYVQVPHVYPDLSSENAITMSRLSGMHLDAFLAAQPAQALRDTVGERLTELYYFQLLRVGAFHADPHWGNYLFRDDGSIGLVDFGCVKYVPSEFVENLKKVFLYPGSRDTAEFRQLLDERYAMYGQALGAEAKRALVGFAERFYGRFYPWEPEAEEVPIDFGEEGVMREYMRETMTLSRAQAALPEYVFLARAETGLYQTLHRLRARVRTSRIVRGLLG
jgi:aarF domain-containing kinase